MTDLDYLHSFELQRIAGLIVGLLFILHLSSYVTRVQHYCKCYCAISVVGD